MALYQDRDTLADALRQYFDRNQFGPDGGYGSAWVDFKLGPIPFPIPNTDARKRAVRIHDLHHVVTGYETTFAGELEIAAWEVASGCRDFAAAWVLNLSGMAAGALLYPRRTFAAFLRGVNAGTLYDEAYDDRLLGKTVGEVREHLGLSAPTRRARPAVAARFAGSVIAGFSIAIPLFVILLPVAMVMWPVLTLSRRVHAGGAALSTGARE